MKRYAYTRNASADLRGIVLFTIGTWGEAQASRYLEEIEDCCEWLARSPRMGRRWTFKGRLLRRMGTGSHVIFYRELDSGILVSRILHKSMLPRLQSFDED